MLLIVASALLVMNVPFPTGYLEDLPWAQFWLTDATAGYYDDHEDIEGFSLSNSGWFVAKIACYYSTDDGVTWRESGHTGGIAMGGGDLLILKDVGVPEHALVKIHVIVVGGKDRTATGIYRCYYSPVPDYNHCYAACYTISGVTWNPVLSFIMLQSFYW